MSELPEVREWQSVRWMARYSWKLGQPEDHKAIVDAADAAVAALTKQVEEVGREYGIDATKRIAALEAELADMTRQKDAAVVYGQEFKQAGEESQAEVEQLRWMLDESIKHHMEHHKDDPATAHLWTVESYERRWTAREEAGDE